MLPIFRHTPQTAEGWSPLAEDGVDGGAIRLYRSDRGTVKDGAVTRFRMGHYAPDVTVGSHLAAALAWNATSLTVDSADAFPAELPFFVFIEGEQITVTAIADEVFTVTRETHDSEFTANAGSDEITHGDYDIPSLTRVRFTTTTTLPGGLSLATDYWTVRQSAGVSKVATSYANASGNTTIDITSAGVGTHTVTTFANAHANGAKVTSYPLDGCGMVLLDSGRILHIHGSPSGHASESVNSIRYSDDRGLTWAVLFPDDPGRTGPVRGHDQGYFKHYEDDQEYVYIIGGDPVISPGVGTASNGDIWRLHTGTWEFELVSTQSWLAARCLFMSASFNGAIYVLGGQTDVFDAGSALKTWCKSTNHGVDWTELVDADWDTGRGMVYDPVVRDGYLWIFGGGAFDADTANFLQYNGVWKLSTADEWTEVLADDHEQFSPTQYHNVVDVDGTFLIINGRKSNEEEDGDTAQVDASRDGVTWWPVLLPAPNPFPWGDSHAGNAIVSDGEVLLTNGFQSPEMFIIRPETGPLLSEWRDQKPASTLHLEQATDAQKPVLVAGEFGGKPGVVATGDQIMALADPDLDIVEDPVDVPGGFECWAIIKSRNFNEDPQGCIIVGSRLTDGAVSLLNLSGAKLQHVGSGAAVATSLDDVIKDDVPHLIGVQFYPGETPLLFVDGVLIDDDTTHPTFLEGYTGWQAIFSGGTGGGGATPGTAALAMGALVIRKGASAPWDATAIAKLVAWTLRTFQIS